MPTICTRCDGTGFINLHQMAEDELEVMRASGDFCGAMLHWLAENKRKQDEIGGCSCFQCAPCSHCMLATDIEVCDCCGNGTE